MSKQIKGMLVAEIQNRLGETRELLVVDSAGVDAVTTNRMRLSLREQSISAMTVRNTLAKKALNDIGVTSLDPYLEGPSTLIWGGEDIVALSKEIAKWAKEVEPFAIKGGTAEGSSLTAGEVDELSKCPSREELIAQIIGLALSPGAKLSAALLGTGGMLAGQIESVGDGKED